MRPETKATASGRDRGEDLHADRAQHAGRRTRVADLVQLARPHHWLKNAFILMPVPFAIATGSMASLPTLLAGVAGFCLLTSAVYALNDVVDASSDRHHPVKQRRPVASGRVPRGPALVFAGTLLAVGLGLLALTGKAAAMGIAVLYLATNLVYSFGARRVPLIDVFFIASGFVLRALLGCVLVAAAPSNWLLLCASTLALLLALGKRRDDAVTGLGTQHRASLSGYSERFLDQAIGITASVTLVSYALYCIDGRVLRPGREFASLPFVAFGVLEYVRLIHMRGGGGSPVDLLLSSPGLILSGLGWLVAVVWGTGLL